MIASRDYHCDPFSTKDTVGGITSPALDKLVICPHGKEIMLVYRWSHDQSNVVAFLNSQLIAKRIGKHKVLEVKANDYSQIWIFHIILNSSYFLPLLFLPSAFAFNIVIFLPQAANIHCSYIATNTHSDWCWSGWFNDIMCPESFRFRCSLHCNDSFYPWASRSVLCLVFLWSAWKKELSARINNKESFYLHFYLHLLFYKL